jgi:hypothetical protein
VDEIKQRNPDIASETFQLLRGKFGNTTGIDTRPFPIVQGTLIGPLDLIPFTPFNRNYSLIEWTPLTAGVAYTKQVIFIDGNNSEAMVKTMGGFIEPFAFNTMTAPATGLPAGERSGTLTVPTGSPGFQCNWALASATSSWDPGCLASASTDPLYQMAVGSLNYWSPSAATPQATQFTTGDGSGVSNTNLISLLQRGVTSIIAFMSSSVPMQNSTHWDPVSDPLSTTSIDFTVPAWFGYMAEDLTFLDIVSYDLQHSHVFESSEWLPMITGLQEAQAIGKGAVISMTHTTVHNSHYGIPAGLKIKVVWIYLGRATQWEDQLNDEMKDLVIPKDDPENQANTIADGPFQSFPHYPSSVASQTPSKANLLADLAGWTIYQHQDLIREILGMESRFPTCAQFLSFDDAHGSYATWVTSFLKYEGNFAAADDDDFGYKTGYISFMDALSLSGVGGVMPSVMVGLRSEGATFSVVPGKLDSSGALMPCEIEATGSSACFESHSWEMGLSAKSFFNSFFTTETSAWIAPYGSSMTNECFRESEMTMFTDSRLRPVAFTGEGRSHNNVPPPSFHAPPPPPHGSVEFSLTLKDGAGQGWWNTLKFHPNQYVLDDGKKIVHRGTLVGKAEVTEKVRDLFPFCSFSTNLLSLFSLSFSLSLSLSLALSLSLSLPSLSLPLLSVVSSR